MRPGDWLDEHEEEHQPFAEYVASSPVRAEGTRRRLDVVSFGDVPPAHEAVVAAATDLLAAVFGLPTRRVLVPTGAVPAHARRRAPGSGREQLLTSWLRDRVLLPRVDDETAVILGLTATDLWPGPGWDFVFGQASLRERVGVWSMARFGDPVREWDVCLRRTLATAVHETGHMFSILHCVAFSCLMAGSNHTRSNTSVPPWIGAPGVSLLAALGLAV